MWLPPLKDTIQKEQGSKIMSRNKEIGRIKEQFIKDDNFTFYDAVRALEDLGFSLDEATDRVSGWEAAALAAWGKELSESEVAR